MSSVPSRDVEEWKTLLIGKTFDPNGDRAVDTTSLSASSTFTTGDLPNSHRVLPPGAIMTRDFREDRLNVFLNDDNTVTQVYFA
jgi:hypothetical protein